MYREGSNKFKKELSMASQFYLVHHHIKPNMSDAWWAKVGGQTEEDSKQNEKSMMEKGFFNHSFMPMGPDGPMYCVWEVKEGISASEFQDFIDGPDGVNFGLVALNNNVMQLNLELTGGQTPYDRKF